jgi:hypothetical protein
MVGAVSNSGWGAALVEAHGSNFDLLLGRRTYDLWATYWPNVKDGPFAGNLNAATKYVATLRPESLGWGPVGNLGADIMEGVRRIKATDGPDLVGQFDADPSAARAGTRVRNCAGGLPVLLGRANAAFRTAPTRGSSRSSARRPRPPA